MNIRKTAVWWIALVAWSSGVCAIELPKAPEYTLSVAANRMQGVGEAASFGGVVLDASCMGQEPEFVIYHQTYSGPNHEIRFGVAIEGLEIIQQLDGKEDVIKLPNPRRGRTDERFGAILATNTGSLGLVTSLNSYAAALKRVPILEGRVRCRIALPLYRYDAEQRAFVKSRLLRSSPFLLQVSDGVITGFGPIGGIPGIDSAGTKELPRSISPPAGAGVFIRDDPWEPKFFGQGP